MIYFTSLLQTKINEGDELNVTLEHFVIFQQISKELKVMVSE